MDPNETLSKIREEVWAMNAYSRDDSDEAVAAVASHGYDLADLVAALDDWLTRGGFPPEAWREGPDAVGAETGPDAVGVDRLNQRIDQALLAGYRKATATNHATILRLEQEIYELRNGGAVGETLDPDGSHAVSCRCGQCVEE